MKRFATTILLVVSMLGVGAPKSVRPVSQSEALAATAEEFFRVWLLRRDVKAAMNFISPNPILGSCMTPDHLDEKILSRANVRDVFREVLTYTLKVTPKEKTLAAVIESFEAIPAEDSNVIFAKHRRERYFQIFRLKPYEWPDYVAYICKFDERRSFREAVGRPNVYYLVATIKRDVLHGPVDVELLWVRQRGRWRILTIAALED